MKRTENENEAIVALAIAVLIGFISIVVFVGVCFFIGLGILVKYIWV